MRQICNNRQKNPILRGIINIIYISDIIQAKKDYTYDKFREKNDFIDIEARNSDK